MQVTRVEILQTVRFQRVLEEGAVNASTRVEDPANSALSESIRRGSS